eukprot:gene17995-11326_t
MLQVLLVLALAPTDIGTGTGWTPGYFTEPSDGADSIGGWGAAPPADPLCSIPRERWCVGDEEVYAKKNADGTRGARQCLDRIRFKRIYGKGQKPVLISGLMDQWKARQLWRKPALLEKYGDMKTMI